MTDDIRRLESDERRNVLSRRSPGTRLAKPIDLRDYEKGEKKYTFQNNLLPPSGLAESPISDDDEDDIPQIDWEGPKPLPLGRDRLPQLGEMLYRPGKRKGRPRTKLPKGFYDRDGSILPVQGEDRR